MKIRRLQILLLSCLILCAACDLITPPKTLTGKKTDVNEIIRVDNEFSTMSKHVGIKKAYMEYMSDEGVLLRPDFLPISGAKAIDYLSTLSDEDYELSWVPQGGMLADSGELGFTYGIYNLKTEDKTYEGTYLNIWKKKGGRWKYVLNTSNSGISSNQ